VNKGDVDAEKLGDIAKKEEASEEGVEEGDEERAAEAGSDKGQGTAEADSDKGEAAETALAAETAFTVREYDTGAEWMYHMDGWWNNCNPMDEVD